MCMYRIDETQSRFMKFLPYDDLIATNQRRIALLERRPPPLPRMVRAPALSRP